MADKKDSSLGGLGGCTGVVLLLVGFAVVQNLGDCGSRTIDSLLGRTSPTPTASAPTASPVTRTPAATVSYLIFAGDRGFIAPDTEGRDVIAGTTRENYEALLQALSIKDQMGMNQMFLQGRLIVLEGDTRVLALTNECCGGTMQVRVLDGRHGGRPARISARSTTVTERN